VWIGVLGPLEVRVDGALVEVPGARLRTLLILLALPGGGMVATDRLVDGLWGEEPPAGVANALQSLVSRLRRAIPTASIEALPSGYRLVVGPDDVDVVRFERLVAEGRARLDADLEQAARVLREALGLWRGPALVDAAGAGFAEAVTARLDELRLQAVEDRVEADLRLDNGAALVGELTELVAAQPLRERLVGALMRALAAAGRPAEALTVYERARRALADELGADPSAELSALHVEVLRGEQQERPRTNLRAGLTSFVGRDEDVTRVGKLVGEYRLTTLTGPGGSGKTRLSIEAARTLLEQTPDGVWLVELAPVSDGVDLPQTVLAALGVREQLFGRVGQEAGGAEPINRLVAALGSRRMVLLLDNCEHLIEAAAALADRLLGECPRLRILTTSREPLGITGEALWPVEPLALPPTHADAVEAMRYPAVRLLVDRASMARPGFTVDEHVVRICRALDGMPLAIELAAARMRTMTAEQVAARLDDRFRLLTSGSRVALPRHQTLRAVVDWSWDLLAEEERVLLRRLAVFAGGATVEAAERVCAGDEDVLAALAEKSLLVTGADGEPRYRMLETIKAYGLERLDEAGERERIRRAHAAYFVELAEAAEPRLRRHDQLAWIARLSADHDNLNAALRGAIAVGDAETAARLVAAAGWYWWLAGHKAEGAELAAEALALPGAVAEETRAAACAITALLTLDGLRDERGAEHWFRTAHGLTKGKQFAHPLLRLLDPLDRVLRGYRQAVELPAHVIDPLLADEDPWVRGTSRVMRAHVLLNAGQELALAERDFEVALAEFRSIGERWGISMSLSSSADLVAWRGDLQAAIAYHEQALATVIELVTSEDVVHIWVKLAHLRWRTGDDAGSAAALADAEREANRLGLPEAIGSVAHLKGELARWTGDAVAARRELNRALTIARNVTVAPQFRAIILDALGYVDIMDGDLDASRAHRAEAFEVAMRSLDAPVIAQVLVGVAELALHQGNAAEAAALLAAGVAVRGTADTSRVDTERVETAVRAALSEPELAEAARRGASTSMATVRDLAAVTLGAGTPAPQGVRTPR
jgi:predicted ATPase/DNA-binding SARP family transcriptional activator